MAEFGKSESSENIYIEEPEHLEGSKPIIACIGTEKEHEKGWKQIENINDSGLDVNFFGKTMELIGKGFKAGGEQTYVISPITEKPLRTRGLRDCTSVVVVGTDAKTGEQISFISHQNPKEFLKDIKDRFTRDFNESLEELKNRCVPGSIDVVICGGRNNPSAVEGYKNSLKTLSSAINERMGFVPTVICGSKNAGEDDIYFKPKDRQLHIVRPDGVILDNRSFLATPENIDQIKSAGKDGMEDLSNLHIS